MSKQKLYNVARHYLSTIDQMERTSDADRLAELEEERVMWHNRLITLMRRQGIPFKDREHITRLAHRIVRDAE